MASQYLFNMLMLMAIVFETGCDDIGNKLNVVCIDYNRVRGHSSIIRLEKQQLEKVTHFYLEINRTMQKLSGGCESENDSCQEIDDINRLLGYLRTERAMAHQRTSKAILDTVKKYKASHHISLVYNSSLEQLCKNKVNITASIIDSIDKHGIQYDPPGIALLDHGVPRRE